LHVGSEVLLLLLSLDCTSLGLHVSSYFTPERCANSRLSAITYVCCLWLWLSPSLMA